MSAASIGLYIHVPYCRVVCPYCDYVKKRTKGPVPESFVRALCAEIEAFEGPNEGRSIFFGGGTPSLLDPAGLERILGALSARFTLHEPEVSLEANPDDITEDLVAAWKDLGVTRISLGVQSFDNAVLGYLGRLHDAEAARTACARVASAFDNWGMDLIFGAPPVEAWEATLEEGLGYAPPHISTYGLTFEERTPFWKRREEAIDPDLSLSLYRQGISRLGQSGYDHYEISNFAQDGYQSLHNLIYWRNEEYAGFGPGAYSYVDGLRSRNAVKTDAYLGDPCAKVEALCLSDREISVETLIQHFRTRAGLGKQAYFKRFGRPVRDDFGAPLDRLIERGLLLENDDGLRPTQAGFELNDEIGLALVSESVYTPET